MSRQSIGYFDVELDPVRGTFTLHSNWIEELWHVVFSSFIIVWVGCLGLGALEVGGLALLQLPEKGWPWSLLLKDLHLRILILGVGAGCLYLSLRTFIRIGSRTLRGFPPIVFDRVQCRCREGGRTVFRLDGLAYLDVKPRSFLGLRDAEDPMYVVRLHFSSGKVRACPATETQLREDCELLASALADFLKIPAVGLKTNGK